MFTSQIINIINQPRKQRKTACHDRDSNPSNVTTDIRPGVIRRPDNSVGRALARNARGPGSNPGRDMLFFFAFLVGYIFIYYLTCKHFLEVFVDI